MLHKIVAVWLLLLCAPAHAQEWRPAGNVVGPANSTDGDIPTFNGAAGTLLRDSGLKYSSGTLTYGVGGYTGAALLGPSNSNPYSATYYDVQPLAKNVLFSSDGTMTVINRYGYGDLETGTAGNFTVNSLKPGCVNGFTSPNQVATLPALGSVGLCSQADTVASMGTVAGSFTATTFVPTSPITLSSSLFVKTGMWLRSSDAIPFAGQVTGWATNGSGQVTSITVSQWFREGDGGVAGTPGGVYAYLNPQDYAWASLPAVYLNTFSLTGNTTNGSTAVTGVTGLTTQATKYQLISGTGIPAGTVIADFDPPTNTITLSQQATATNTAVSLTVSSAPLNRAAAAEVDIYNNAQAAAPVVVTVTGSTTNGSRTIASVSVNPQTNAINPGMVVYGTGIPAGAVIRATTSNSITINQPATATGSVTLTVFTVFDQGGVGLDIDGVVNAAQTGIALRGSLYYGTNCMGASGTCYLMQPNGYAAIPSYGFRVDGAIAGHASAYDFAVTNGAALKWGVTGGGSQITTGITSSTGGGSAQFIANDTAGVYRQMQFQTNASSRFLLGINDVLEGGANTGSNFVVLRYNDAGVVIDTPLQITRSSGATTLASLTITGASTLTGAVAAPAGITVGTTTLIASSVSLTNGAAAQTATLTNGPAAGNPTKWIPINDNGTTRYIPAW